MNRFAKRGLAMGLCLWVGAASAVPTEWAVESGGNGHWYEMGIYRTTWDQARADAASRTHAGLPGYLATVTSAGEAAFIGQFRAPGNYGSGWLSGSDAAVEGDWRWMDGPEAGQLFWRGGSDGAAFGYAGWSGGWPNHEDYLIANGGGVLWGSYPLEVGEFFYVEYSALVPEPAAMALWLAGLAGLGVLARRRATATHACLTTSSSI